MKMRTVDMHCDTLSALRKLGEGASLLRNGLHIDLDKLEQGGYLLQNFAMFVNGKKEADPWEAVQQMIRLFLQQMEENRDRIAQVFCYEDILRQKAAGKISALLTVEEGAVCAGKISRLGQLYEQGVRMLTLTWNYPNELGYPNVTLRDGIPDFKTPETKQGLTRTGIQFVEEMERLGMIPDVSHLSDAGFYDVAEHTRKPFVASHSNARAVCPSIRNLTDDMIRVLAERGGVTGLNFCADFLTEVSDGEENPGTIQAVVAHAKHITRIGGVECLGIGSDFDGIPTHEQLPDASYLPRLTEALRNAGFTMSQIDKIMGSNVLRVYRDCL